MTRYLFSIGFLVLASTSSIRAQISNDLRSRHFGVLSEEEIQYEEKITSDRPYRTAPGILYWTCFETKNVQFKFNSLGYDSDEKRLMADAEIEVVTNNSNHKYLFRRGIHSSLVKNFIHEWNRLIHHQSYACISGYAVDEEMKKSEGETISVYYWSWDKLKTKRGCVAYFGFTDGCEIDD